MPTYNRAHQRRPLSDHLNDFEAHLKTKDTTAKQVRLTMARCRALADGCGFTLLRDIVLGKVQEWLAPQRGKPRAAGGFSNQTSNYYLGAFHHFCRWCCECRPKRLHEDPLEGAEGVNAAVDRRHLRRELTLDGLRQLLQAARTSPRRYKGLNGEACYHVHLTAIGTSYRCGEPIWPGSWGRGKGAGMLRLDLQAAGIPYVVQGADGPCSPTSMPCDTVTSAGWPGRGSTRRWPRCWPGTVTRGSRSTSTVMPT